MPTSTSAKSATTAPYTTIDGGTFGTGPNTLVLALAEDAYNGDATANVTVDGKVLNLQPLTVTALRTAGQVELFTFKGNFGAGAHDLAVSFLNDAYGGTPLTDRNLYVNGATYDGIATRPPMATLFSAETRHFTIPPAGDPEAGGGSASGPSPLRARCSWSCRRLRTVKRVARLACSVSGALPCPSWCSGMGDCWPE